MTWRTCFSYLFEGAYNTTLHLLGGFKTRSISLGELSFQARGKIADLTLWSIYIYIHMSKYPLESQSQSPDRLILQSAWGRGTDIFK